MTNQALQTAREALEPFAWVAKVWATGNYDSWMDAYRAASIGDAPYRRAVNALAEIDAALAAEGEPTLPYDIDLGGIRFRAGVKLWVFINAARRWYDKARATAQPSPHPPEGEERGSGSGLDNKLPEGEEREEPEVAEIAQRILDRDYPCSEVALEAKIVCAAYLAGLSARRADHIPDVGKMVTTPSQSEVAGLVAEARAFVKISMEADAVECERYALEPGHTSYGLSGAMITLLADALTRTTPAVEPVLGEVGESAALMLETCAIRLGCRVDVAKPENGSVTIGVGFAVEIIAAMNTARTLLTGEQKTPPSGS